MDYFVSGEVIFVIKVIKYFSYFRKGGFYWEVEFVKIFYIGDFKVKFYLVGYMFGLVGIKFWFENGMLFYIGDIKWFKLRMVEKSCFFKVDVFIIEVIFGVLSFMFLFFREVEKKLVVFVEEVFDRGKCLIFYVN